MSQALPATGARQWAQRSTQLARQRVVRTDVMEEPSPKRTRVEEEEEMEMEEEPTEDKDTSDDEVIN